jgi:hypothetical protein
MESKDSDISPFKIKEKTPSKSPDEKRPKK